MAICANCGHEVDGSKKRCTNCGVPLRDISIDASLSQQPTLGIASIEALSFEIPERSSDDLLNYSFGLDLDKSVGSAAFATGDLIQNGEDLAHSLDSSSSVLNSSVSSSSGFFNSASTSELSSSLSTSSDFFNSVSSSDTSSSIIASNSSGAEFSLDSSLSGAASALEGSLASADSVLNGPQLSDNLSAVGAALQDDRIKLSQSYGEARRTYESTRDEVKANLQQAGRSLRQGMEAAKAGQAQAGRSVAGRAGAMVAGAAAMTAGVAQAASAISSGASAIARGTQQIQTTYEDTSQTLANRVKRLSDVVSSNGSAIEQLVASLNGNHADIVELQKAVNRYRNNALAEMQKFDGGRPSVLSGKSKEEIKLFRKQVAEADKILKRLFVEGGNVSKIDTAIRVLRNDKSGRVDASSMTALQEQIQAMSQSYGQIEREAKMFFAWWQKVSQDKGKAQAAAATAAAAVGLAAGNVGTHESAAHGIDDSSDDVSQRLERERAALNAGNVVSADEINTNLGMALLVTVLCCLPVGIVAIFMSFMSSYYKSAGDLEKAKEYASKSFMWSGYSAVGGFIFWILMFIFTD